MFAPSARPQTRGVRESPRVLGQLLVAAGSITADELAGALHEQQRTRDRIGEILIRRGTEPERVGRALAQQLKLSFVPAPLSPQRDALALVDRPTAARLHVVPIALHEKIVRVAMADPLDIHAIDDLQFRTGRRIEPVVATPQAVEHALSAYDTTEIATLLDRIPTTSATTPSEDDLRRASEAPPVVALLDHILARAAAARASDVHVEPEPGRMLVRIRVDGLLRELTSLPAHVMPAFTSRIKVTAGLDISIRRKPQDGRCTFRCAGQEVSARVSTLPAQYGEKIVLRLFNANEDVARLSDVGMSEPMLAQLRILLKRAHGIILVTGPTGSGKTSTLYAALAEMDARTRNIVTLEDPVEKKLAGITQVQVQRRGGTTFAKALRAVLRQDPDVILVGELRDRETVETALAAALTGHLVLATLHTNDAATAAVRLTEMGAAPYLVSGALIGVVAQRLVRRVCQHCRSAEGCSHCDKTGFRGRIGVFEVLPVSSETRVLINRRASAEAIARQAMAEGAQLMADDARSKLDGGLTSSDEVASILLAQFA
jgi:type IV pilus assembly protein PilB